MVNQLEIVKVLSMLSKHLLDESYHCTTRWSQDRPVGQLMKKLEDP